MVSLDDAQAKLFLRTVQSRPNIFAHHVKKLCMDFTVESDTAKEILRLCSDIDDLAIWAEYQVSPHSEDSYRQLLSSFRLRRLSTELQQFESLFDQSNRWTTTLTHLDIYWYYDDLLIISNLEKLSMLTHLALRLSHNKPSTTFLQDIFPRCRNLKIMVITSLLWTEGVWQAEPRIVTIKETGNAATHWESRASNNKTSIWRRAEDLIRLKSIQVTIKEII